jgi:hypothetical protein
MSTLTSSLKLNNIVIESRSSDKFINATQMCKAGGKQFNHWHQLNSTKELITELSNDMNLPIQQLIEVKKGRHNSGSWIHPRLATMLAQWISPKFAVKVSRWIEEWKEIKSENNEEFHREIFSLIPSHSQQLERKIQATLQKKLSAEIEVKTAVGYIDLMTDTEIIEIKEISKWKHALGQILSYGVFYPQKSKKIILFGGNKTIETIENTEVIEDVCDRFNVAVEYFLE